MTRAFDIGAPLNAAQLLSKFELKVATREINISNGQYRRENGVFVLSDWNKDIVKIREAILNLKQDLAKAAPKDRLDYVSSIMECIQFMKQSNIGWSSFLTNPQIANGLDEEALKDIFEKFRKIAIERIDGDVDSIDRYIINLVPRDVDADSWI